MKKNWIDEFEEAVANRDEFVTKFHYQQELERIIDQELENRLEDWECDLDHCDDDHDVIWREAQAEAIEDCKRALDNL